ncbi:ACP S-malonyltransferase [Halobacteriales archaeon QS_1_69_70]|nr:MAG: ACP S-malonyltransferase [Halobacteriales archaeon QS_1_69_70]
MKTAFVFPGQGSQEPGMGKQFYRQWEATEACLKRLSEAVEIDLAALCFEGDAERLQSTENTQPAVFSVGLSVYEGLQRRFDLDPDYVTGHSLGHFTALTSADGLPPEKAVQLVRRRGEIMADVTGTADTGKMVAVLLVDPADVVAACEEFEDVGVAGFNGPRQMVISGGKESVDRVQARIENSNRARFVELAVGAPFHSPLMLDAKDAFREYLEEDYFDDPSIPVVSDVSGDLYTDAIVPESELVEQITAPVNWVGVVETLRDVGVERYIELPPTGEIGEMIHRIHSGAEVISIDSPKVAAEEFG